MSQLHSCHPTLGRLRQEDQNFEARLDYRPRPCLKIQTKKVNSLHVCCSLDQTSFPLVTVSAMFGGHDGRRVTPATDFHSSPYIQTPLQPRSPSHVKGCFPSRCLFLGRIGVTVPAHSLTQGWRNSSCALFSHFGYCILFQSMNLLYCSTCICSQ